MDGIWVYAHRFKIHMQILPRCHGAFFSDTLMKTANKSAVFIIRLSLDYQLMSVNCQLILLSAAECRCDNGGIVDIRCVNYCEARIVFFRNRTARNDVQRCFNAVITHVILVLQHC